METPAEPALKSETQPSLEQELAACRAQLQVLSAALEEMKQQAAQEKGRAEALELALKELPRIVTGGGEPLKAETVYTREQIAGMSAEEINSHWQGIKNSLKKLF